MVAGKIWDDLECCDWMIKDQAVKLRDNVGTTLVLRYDDEQTEVSHTHFAIERLLNGGIADKDEVAGFEVIFDDGGSVTIHITHGLFSFRSHAYD